MPQLLHIFGNMIQKIEIISVNYNTPDLIDRLIKSVREVEGDYRIRIIDGSDKEPYKSEIVDVCSKYENVILEQQGFNIHHGGSMHLGVTTSNFEYCLILDSDNYIQQPIIKSMYEALINNNKMMIGFYCHVNNSRINISRYYSDRYPIKYYHPSLFMIKKDYYLSLNSIGVKFIKHGAPSIQIMKYLHDNKISDVVGIDLWEHLGISDSEVGKYTNLVSRGTVNRFGYNL